MISKKNFVKQSPSCDIIQNIGVISTSSKGWQKEINLISWNSAAPKLDIREWSPGHTKMGKGITLSFQELENLKNIIDSEISFEDDEEE